MTVLMLMESPSPHRNPVLNELHARGVDFRVIYLRKGGSLHGWGAADLRHPHDIVGNERQAHAMAQEAIKAGRVDVLVAFGYRTTPYLQALLTARRKRVPIVVGSDTNVDDARTHPPLRRLLRRMMLRLAVPRSAVAWTIGSKNAEFWACEAGVRNQHRIPYETPVLPGCCPPQNRHRERLATLRILFVGRLIPVKQVGDILDAGRLLPPEVDWRLTVVGDGPEGPGLRRKAADEPRVRFVGSVEQGDLDRYYRAADVLVLPSAREAWGLVVNEALGFGVRVIATTAVGAAYDLLHESNGATYPPGDVVALARELVRSAEITFQRGREPATDTASLMLQSLQTVQGLAPAGGARIPS